MPRVRWKDFSKRRLWVSGSPEGGPEGSFRRLKGAARLRESTLRSRNGSQSLYSLDAHSLVRFGDVRFQGASTAFYRDGSSIKTGLDGTRLSFVTMPPTGGKADSLFVTGGGSLFKVDTSGNVTGWGIDAPADGMTAAVSADGEHILETFQDHQTNWTATNCTLSDEATVKIAGNSMQMAVVKNNLGSAIYDLGAADDFTSQGGGPLLLPDESYITFWVLIDNPENLDYLEVAFDVADASFDSDYYSYRIQKSDLEAAGLQTRTQTFGIGGLDEYSDRDGNVPLSDARSRRWNAPEKHRALERLSQPVIISSPAVWTKVRIPRSLFVRAGSSSATWTTVYGYRLSAKANGKGNVNVYFDTMTQYGQYGLIGNYKYHITYYNSTTGHRSDANSTALETSSSTGKALITDREKIVLLNIPTSTDSQVDKVEIWRTVGDGTLFFKIDEIDNGTATYTDTIPDILDLDGNASTSMSDTELPTDNTEPASTYEDCFGPYNGAVFWCRDTASGGKGRVYYSPVGRPESVKGFVQVSRDDDPTQKGVVWNDSLWVFTESRIFRMWGEDPYFYGEVQGAPGTTAPFTVVPTPIGIIYQANDGIRLFNGSTSTLIGFDALGRILRGESSEGIAAFTGVVAATSNDEYLISDETTTLALALDGTWREIGLAIEALDYEEDTGAVIASWGSTVYALEQAGLVKDSNTAITFVAEPQHVAVGAGKKAVVQRLYVEANTGGQSITPTLILDGVETALPAFSNSARGVQEWALLESAEVVGVRLSGSLSQRVEIHEIALDVHDGSLQA